MATGTGIRAGARFGVPPLPLLRGMPARHAHWLSAVTCFVFAALAPAARAPLPFVFAMPTYVVAALFAIAGIAHARQSPWAFRLTHVVIVLVLVLVDAFLSWWVTDQLGLGLVPTLMLTWLAITNDRAKPASRPRPASAIADDDMEWLSPPCVTQDPSAWDRYWTDQASHGLTPPLFDMFCDDEELIRHMAARGMTRVLCVGNGISQEPRALAEAGLQVVALDLSPVASQLSQTWESSDADLEQFYGPSLRRPGGRIEFVAGDLLDPTVCPGPFDVVIERRTLQIFSPDERPAALDALSSRLTAEGILLSHCHDGSWRPPEPREHALEGLFRRRGWAIGRDGATPGERAAWLILSTG
jgi:hypothetical protein